VVVCEPADRSSISSFNAERLVLDMPLIGGKELAIAGAILLLVGFVTLGIGQFWAVPAEQAANSCAPSTPNATHCEQLSQQASNATIQSQGVSGIGWFIAGGGGFAAVFGLISGRADSESKGPPS